MRKELVGLLLLILATSIYGFFPILSKGSGFALPFFYSGFIRITVALLILAAITVIYKQWKTVQKKDLVWFFFRGLAGIVAYTGFFYSVNFLSVGTSLFIFYAGSTIGGYVLGSILFKEKLNTIKYIAFGIAMAGLLCIYASEISISKPLYLSLAFIAGFGTATWNAFSKRIVDRYSTAMLGVVDSIIYVIAIAIISLMVQEVWVVPSLTAPWFTSVAFGIGWAAVSFLTVMGFARLEVQKASLVMLTEIIFGIIFAYLFFRENPSLLSYLGGFMILVAMILPEVNWQKFLKRFS